MISTHAKFKRAATLKIFYHLQKMRLPNGVAFFFALNVYQGKNRKLQRASFQPIKIDDLFCRVNHVIKHGVL